MPDEIGAPAPPPPPPPTSSNRSVMLVLSYLGILARIPLLTEKNDREVQWHAKHGLVLFGAYLVLTVGLFVASLVAGFLGVLQIPLWLGYLVVIVLGITSALNGKRFVVPGVSELAEKL